MVDRIEMVNSVTGTLMYVPVELVASFELAGHKRCPASAAAEDAADDVPETDTEGATSDVPETDTESNPEPIRSKKGK